MTSIVSCMLIYYFLSQPQHLQQPSPYGVGALGRIEPRSTIISIFPEETHQTAVIETLFVEEGDLVEKGQQLARLADYKLRQFQFKAKEKYVEVLQAKLTSQNAECDRAQQEFDRRSKLAENKAISKAQEDDAELRLKAAEAEILALKAEIAMAEAQREEAKNRFEKSMLTSPLDGTVLALRSHPGESITEGGALDIADLSRIDVVAEVFELDIVRVKKGQKVEITIPSSSKKYKGTVRHIGYLVEKNKLNHTDPLASKDNRIIEVKISVDDSHVKDFRHLLLTKVHVKIAPS